MNLYPWQDITRHLYPGMPVWPGDHPVEEQRTSSIAGGDTCNVSCWTFSSHTGTHVDPPLHFEADGASVDRMDLNVLCGRCRVLDVTGVRGHITAANLAGVEGSARLLLKTRNSQSDPSVFHEDFVALTPAAAALLAGTGVRVVGIDGPSVEPFHAAADYPIHHTLLRDGVAVVEGLALAEIEPGEYEFVCLPLPWRNGDGSPCRAMLRRL
jgi:arylformamidase